MKKIFGLTLFCIIASYANAQHTTTISGKLLNCTDIVLELNPSTGNFRDSIKVNADGTFNYTTTQIKTPFRANLTNRKQIQIQLFVAPGYDLQISADVKDSKTSKSTLKYEGLGSKTNKYWEDVMGKFNTDTVKWVNKDEDTYISYLKSSASNTDLIDKNFNANNEEPFSAYFKQSLLLDKKFSNFLSIYSSYAYKYSYKWPQIQNMIAKLGYKPLLEEFKDERNLASLAFSYLVTEYPFYFDNYNAFPADSLVKNAGNYSLYLADKFYKGKVYDYYATQQIESSLKFIYKFEDFEKLKPYITKIGDLNLKNKIKSFEDSRIKDVMNLLPGAPSPLFNLADTSGNFHQLANMKGRVIYIDLWASWCGPCKEETPYLKKIYEELKNNDKVQIISIAAFDAKNRTRRYEIIKKDQMDWLQLEDTEDSFAKSYLANSIPRFIIIDKQGKIVNSDAVRPSDPEKLMAILNREINK